jgi:Protein of unknown function (DUF2889)
MTRGLWPGNAGPATATPDRQPGAVRRTMSVDGHRPDGPRGRVVLQGRARDLATAADGSATLLDASELTVDADADWDVTAVRVEPPQPRLEALVGISARHGFRRAAHEVLPHRANDGSLLVTLLEEIPITVSLSRLALIAKGAMKASDRPVRVEPAVRAMRTAPRRPVCAGWVAEGALARNAAESGGGLITEGVEAPSMTRPDDPVAWHDMPPIPPEGFRRRRRYDVDRDDDGTITIDAWFRDAYLADDGAEVALHEYSLDARVNSDTFVVTAIAAVDRVLPGPECRNAAASVEVAIGHRVDDLPALVRERMSGSTMCTHLSDAVFALGGLHAVVASFVAC